MTDQLTTETSAAAVAVSNPTAPIDLSAGAAPATDETTTVVTKLVVPPPPSPDEVKLATARAAIAQADADYASIPIAAVFTNTPATQLAVARINAARAAAAVEILEAEIALAEAGQ